MTDHAEVLKNAALVQLEQLLRSPEGIMQQIGMLMVSESQQAFKAQRFGDIEWKPRGVPNVMGVISDFAMGRKEPVARRFQDRPALMDTGRLRMSIAFKVVAANVVQVGSNLPYAKTLHDGGESESAPITEEMQKRIYAWLKASGKPYRAKLGFLLNKKYRNATLKTNVPARPFVGLTDQLVADIEEVIGVTIAPTTYKPNNNG